MTLSPLPTLGDVLGNPSIKLTVAGQLPLEGLAIALIDLAKTERATMNQANRDAFDAILVKIVQRVDAAGGALYKLLGTFACVGSRGQKIAIPRSVSLSGLRSKPS
jgi:hypothetical protein